MSIDVETQLGNRRSTPRSGCNGVEVNRQGGRRGFHFLRPETWFSRSPGHPGQVTPLVSAGLSSSGQRESSRGGKRSVSGRREQKKRHLHFSRRDSLHSPPSSGPRLIVVVESGSRVWSLIGSGERSENSRSEGARGARLLRA